MFYFSTDKKKNEKKANLKLWQSTREQNFNKNYAAAAALERFLVKAYDPKSEAAPGSL